MKKLWLGAVVVLVGLGVTTLVSAQPGPRNFSFWKSEKMVEKLSLTEEQVAKLENIDYNFQKASIDVNARLKSAQLSLDHFLSGEKIRKQKLEGLVDELAQARGEQTKLLLEKKIAIRRVLSLEQWQKVEQGRERLRHRMMNRRKGDNQGRHHRGEGGRKGEPPEKS